MFLEVFTFKRTFHLKEFLSALFIKYLNIANEFIVKNTKDNSNIFLTSVIHLAWIYQYYDTIFFQCVCRSITKFFNDFVRIYICLHQLSIKSCIKFEESFSSARWYVIKCESRAIIYFSPFRDLSFFTWFFIKGSFFL